MGAPDIGAGGLLEVFPNGSPQTGAIIHYADILKGDVNFSVRVPETPGSGNSSIFGLYEQNGGAYMVFTISAALTCDVSDGATAVHSGTIVWNSSWTGVNVNFRIRWEAGSVKFFINDTQVYVAGASIPTGPLSLYIQDSSTQNPGLKVGDINVRGAQAIHFNLKTSDTTSYEGLLNSASEVTVTENVTILVPILVPSLSDAVVVSENYVFSYVHNPSVSDAITVTEAVTPLIPILVPSLSDAVATAENVSLLVV